MSSLRLALTALLLLGLTGCSDCQVPDDGPPDDSPVGDDDDSVPGATTVYGTVSAPRGGALDAIGGAQVILGAQSTVTGPDGSFTLEVEGGIGVALRVEGPAAGEPDQALRYSVLESVVDLDPGTERVLALELLPACARTADPGETVDIGSCGGGAGLSLTFPQDGLGSRVRADVAVFDPSARGGVRAFPAPPSRDDGLRSALVAGVSVELTDPLTGASLAVDPERPVTVRIPIDAVGLDPATLRLVSWDVEAAAWVDEAPGTLDGDTYVFDAPHFSQWAVYAGLIPALVCFDDVTLDSAQPTTSFAHYAVRNDRLGAAGNITQADGWCLQVAPYSHGIFEVWVGRTRADTAFGQELFEASVDVFGGTEPAMTLELPALILDSVDRTCVTGVTVCSPGSGGWDQQTMFILREGAVIHQIDFLASDLVPGETELCSFCADVPRDVPLDLFTAGGGIVGFESSGAAGERCAAGGSCQDLDDVTFPGFTSSLIIETRIVTPNRGGAAVPILEIDASDSIGVDEFEVTVTRSGVVELAVVSASPIASMEVTWGETYSITVRGWGGGLWSAQNTGEITPEEPGDAEQGMVVVPETAFILGCPTSVEAACSGHEVPPHPVIVSAFQIDVYETTMAEYADCVAASGCASPVGGYDYDPIYTPDLPMFGVDWDSAVAYCAWRGKRLPTEAQWEAAARGLMPEWPSVPRTYVWGEAEFTCAHANVRGPWDGSSMCPNTTPEPVGSRPDDVSWIGVYDMAGNVQEFTAEEYIGEIYASRDPNVPTVDPAGPDVELMVAMRGGSWSGNLVPKTWHRDVQHHETVDGDSGWRCVADAP